MFMTKEEFLTGSSKFRVERPMFGPKGGSYFMVTWRNREGGVDQHTGVYAYFHDPKERKRAARLLREYIKEIARGDNKNVKISDIEAFTY